MNKRQKSIYDIYKKSINLNLIDCYRNPSIEKKNIFNHIYNNYFLKDKHSMHFKIIGYNNQMFTCGYLSIKNNRKCLVYFSPSVWGQIIYID